MPGCGARSCHFLVHRRLVPIQLVAFGERLIADAPTLQANAGARAGEINILVYF